MPKSHDFPYRISQQYRVLICIQQSVCAFPSPCSSRHSAWDATLLHNKRTRPCPSTDAKKYSPSYPLVYVCDYIVQVWSTSASIQLRNPDLKHSWARRMPLARVHLRILAEGPKSCQNFTILHRGYPSRVGFCYVSKSSSALPSPCSLVHSATDDTLLHDQRTSPCPSTDAKYTRHHIHWCMYVLISRRFGPHLHQFS